MVLLNGEADRARAARALRAITVPASPAVVPALLPALRAALDGTGPALLPLPADPVQRRRVEAALRPAEPLEAAEGEAATGAAEPALVVPTSGSTGEPRGVLLGAAALRASAAATEERLGGPGRWLLALPATHIAGLQVLVRSLLAGTEPVAVDLSSGFQPAAFAAAAARLGAGRRRYTALVPTQLRRLLDAGVALDRFDAVLVGGAAAPPALLRAAQAAGARVVMTYGMTETSGGCVYDGEPLRGVACRVGDDGLIRVRGPVLAQGYRLQPDRTREVFAGGEFRTADVGEISADGRLVVLGRADDVIVSGGEKVAATAVADALAEHPAVREAAVVGVPDPEWGARVVAVVVLAGAGLRESDASPALREHVAATLGRRAAPRDVVVVPALPRLANGKVDRMTVLRLARDARQP